MSLLFCIFYFALFSSLHSASDIVPSRGIIFGAERDDEAEIVYCLKDSWKDLVRGESIIDFNMSINELNNRLRKSNERYEWLGTPEAFEIMIRNDCKPICERVLNVEELEEIILNMNHVMSLLFRVDQRNLGIRLKNWKSQGSFVKALIYEGDLRANEIADLGELGDRGLLYFWQNLEQFRYVKSGKVGEVPGNLEHASILGSTFIETFADH